MPGNNCEPLALLSAERAPSACRHATGWAGRRNAVPKRSRGASSGLPRMARTPGARWQRAVSEPGGAGARPRCRAVVAVTWVSGREAARQAVGDERPVAALPRRRPTEDRLCARVNSWRVTSVRTLASAACHGRPAASRGPAAEACDHRGPTETRADQRPGCSANGSHVTSAGGSAGAQRMRSLTRPW
jgi:hypothetical protein